MTIETRSAYASTGARDMLPMVIGVAPLALVIGASIRTASIDPVAGWSGSFLLVAGSAQLSMIELLSRGATPVVVIAAVALINARFALYSTAFAGWFEGEPLRRRLWLVFPLVDQLYVLCSARFAGDDGAELDADDRRAYYLGGAVTLMAGWIGMQTIAVVFAGALPDTRVLAIAAPLSLAGLLALNVQDRAAAAAAAGAGVVALIGAGLPDHAGLLLAIVAGAAVGNAIERSVS